MKMKNKIFILFITFLMLFQNVVTASVKNNEIIPGDAGLVLFDRAKLSYHNGEAVLMENTAVKENGDFLVPVDFLLEKLGFKKQENTDNLSYVGKNGLVLSKKDGKITLNQKSVTLTEKNGIFYASISLCDLLDVKYTLRDGIAVIWNAKKAGNADFGSISKLQGIYVSPAGKQSATGDAENPLNSLEAAKKLAERYYNDFGSYYPVYIFVHGGKYKFSETVTFSDKVFSDSSKKGLKIEAYGDGEPVFTGAEEIDATKLKVVKDANILARLPKAGRGQVASMKLSDEGIDSIRISDKSYPFVYVNDIEQIQSRWPNTGFSQVKSLPSSTMMGYDENNPSRWITAQDARINAYFNADYWFGTSKVGSVNPKDKIITLDTSSGGKSFTTSRVGAKWYARNLLEEIDVPGEWFVDRNENVLYFYPPYSLKDKKVEIVTFHNSPMIEIGASKNISVKGITFEKSGGEAIKGTSVDGVRVENCNFRYLQGSYALNFSDVNMNVIVDSNKCYGCAGGFVLCRAGKIDTLESGNTVISNNHISSCGYEPVNGYAAICITNPSNESFKRLVSVGIEVKNNVVQDCVTTNGILWAGCYINIHNNEFLNQSKHLNDHGVIYVGRAHSQRGSEVAFNYVHDLNEEKLIAGLYNDDGYSGTNWHHNVCANMYFSATHGLGLDEIYNYNLSVNCKVPATVGSRMTWSQALYGDNGSLKNEVETALSVGGNAYKKAFPELAESLKRTPYSAPWNSCFFGNVGVNTGGKTLGTTALGELEEYGAKTMLRNGKEIPVEGLNGSPEGNPHFDYSDDYFVDAANQNYNIKPESAIAKAVPELLEIDMESIGLTNPESIKKASSFRLKEPSNGEGAVDSKLITFSWDRVENATKYRLIIATDKKMQNIVYDKTFVENGNCNQAEVDSLMLNTVYYWKVQAIGLARQNQFVVENYNGPYILRTARKNELDKENAEIAINALKEFDEEVSENTEYEYDSEFLQELKNLLEKAEAVYKNAKTQEELDVVEEEIYLLIKKSPFYMKVRFENLDGIFESGVNWTLNYPENIYFKDGVLTVENSDSSTRAYLTAPIKNRNSILCFKMKLDSLSDGSGWQGFDFKLNDSGKGYFVTFKESVIEFQRVGNGLDEMINTCVKPGEWADVQVGAVNTANGVLQFLRINGSIIYAKLDSSVMQTRTEGLFRIRQNMENAMHFKSAESVPEEGMLIKDILEEFYKTGSEQELANLLIGSSDAAGLDSELFAGVDKKKLSDILYPEMSDLEIDIKNTEKLKNLIFEKSILTAFNEGKTEYIIRNNIEFLYPEILKLTETDQNGKNLYSFFNKNLSDINKSEIINGMLNKDFGTVEDLQKSFAKNTFAVSINACGPTFGGDTSYFYEILNKETADYIGINIDRYLNLNSGQKEIVHKFIGRSEADKKRTAEEIVGEINTAIDKWCVAK